MVRSLRTNATSGAPKNMGLSRNHWRCGDGLGDAAQGVEAGGANELGDPGTVLFPVDTSEQPYLSLVGAAEVWEKSLKP